MHRAESIPTNETYPLANIRLDRINQSRPDDPICLPSTSKKKTNSPDQFQFLDRIQIDLKG